MRATTYVATETIVSVGDISRLRAIEQRKRPVVCMGAIMLPLVPYD